MLAMTMHYISERRFLLGLARGFNGLFKTIGLNPITGKQLEDAAGMIRRLWKDGRERSLGKFPLLQLHEKLMKRFHCLWWRWEIKPRSFPGVAWAFWYCSLF